MRRLAWVAGALLSAVLAMAIMVHSASERRLAREYAVTADLPAPDPSLGDEGRRLAFSRGCADCHGEDFGGKLLADEMPFARLVGTNLTRTPDAHADRNVHERMHLALRHGIGLDSRPLLMMPSKSFASLSRHEVEALSAFFGSLPPVQRRLPDSDLGPLGRTLLVAGKLEGFLSAEQIDHAAPAVDKPPALGTVDYGRHAAQLCSGCHRGDFAGGRMSHGGPQTPPASNLTPDPSGLAGWTEADFMTAMRTGRRPDGGEIDGNAMPWRAIGKASDEELRSMWLYLSSLPPVRRDVAAEPPERR